MRRLFVLRPEPAAQATLARARAIGLDAVAMPLFAIEAVAWRAPPPPQFDGLLLSSANTLRAIDDGLRQFSVLPVYAVGEATAAAARAASLAIAAVGDGGIERLLESIDPGLRLLHLCGAERTEFAARQAITAVPVYRAVELPPPPSLRELAGEVAAVHSARAARRLAELVGDRRDIRIAAISPAAAAAAGDGWGRCGAAASPDDGALLALAARLCDKP
jgi:uroporphyrinogen-III synthase